MKTDLKLERLKDHIIKAQKSIETKTGEIRKDMLDLERTVSGSLSIKEEVIRLYDLEVKLDYMQSINEFLHIDTETDDDGKIRWALDHIKRLLNVRTFNREDISDDMRSRIADMLADMILYIADKEMR